MAEFMKPVRDEAGTFFIPALDKKIKIVEWHEGDVYDTVAIPAGAVAAGTNFQFFNNIQNKDPIDTNITTPNKIGAGDEMIVNRIGMYVHNAVGQIIPTPTTMKQVYECGYAEFKINRKLVAEGWLMAFPSGYGLAGNTTEANQGIVSNGVASTAAAMTLARPQLITTDHDLFGMLRFQQRAWIPIATIAAINQMPASPATDRR